MELTLAEFVSMVVLGSGALVLWFTVVSRTLHARSEARSLARRVICRLCLHAFEDDSPQRVLRCPHCGAATERGRSRQLG
jgi:predicted Zn-ribbon and HTH transcriptional regulator